MLTTNAVLLIGKYAIPAFVPLLVLFVILVLDFAWNRYYANKSYQHPIAIRAITKSLNFLTIHGLVLVAILFAVCYFDVFANVC